MTSRSRSAAGVRRLTANNPGPFTFQGTNSYVIGRDNLAVIDPGPRTMPISPRCWRRSADGRSAISSSATRIATIRRSPSSSGQETGAIVCAEGPHRPARPLRIGEINPLDASADLEFMPDMKLEDGSVIDGGDWAIRTILTPGHTANHAVFALEGTGTLFSADHVMGWSTSIVAPPDGAMTDYMASLDRLLARHDKVFLPGHGGPVMKPHKFIRGLKAHRKMRERSIVERLKGRRSHDRRDGDADLSRHRPTTAWRSSAFGAGASGRPGRPRRRGGRRRSFHRCELHDRRGRRTLRPASPLRRPPQPGGASDCAGGSVGTGTSEAGGVASAGAGAAAPATAASRAVRKPAMRAALSPRSWRP